MTSATALPKPTTTLAPGILGGVRRGRRRRRGSASTRWGHLDRALADAAARRGVRWRLLTVRSPLNVPELRQALSNVDRVQFDDPLSRDDYVELARLLEDHPAVTLRVFGTDQSLARLEFLQHFPRLRRLYISCLKDVDLEPVNSLPDDLELLEIDETGRPLNLGVLRFTKLRSLGIARHRKGLAWLLARNRGIEHLALRRLPHDEFLPAELPRLRQLVLVGGSARGLDWIPRFPDLRVLAIGRVRGIDDAALTSLGQARSLEWIRLALLPHVTTLPDLRQVSTLVRVDLDGMRGMVDEGSLATLRDVLSLQDLEVTAARLPVEAFRPLVDHPRLTAATIGLGSTRKNEEVCRMLGVPPAAPAWDYAYGRCRLAPGPVRDVDDRG